MERKTSLSVRLLVSFKRVNIFLIPGICPLPTTPTILCTPGPACFAVLCKECARITSLSSKIVLRTSFSVSLSVASNKTVLNAPSPLKPSFRVDSMIFRAQSRTIFKSFSLIFFVLEEDAADDDDSSFLLFKSISSSSSASASPEGNSTFIPALKILFKHLSTFAGSSHPYFSATSRIRCSGLLNTISFVLFCFLFSLLLSLLPYLILCITRDAVTSALLSPRTTKAPISPATSNAFVNSFPAWLPTIKPPS
mmetsp:Transcript_8689/g.25383  ORF Transcript_8689/g.25383 Transcript_8689/m.25383 type:complete len:252 (+) Transcript_8689:936-1691(+)